MVLSIEPFPRALPPPPPPRVKPRLPLSAQELHRQEPLGRLLTALAHGLGRVGGELRSGGLSGPDHNPRTDPRTSRRESGAATTAPRGRPRSGPTDTRCCSGPEATPRTESPRHRGRPGGAALAVRGRAEAKARVLRGGFRSRGLWRVSARAEEVMGQGVSGRVLRGGSPLDAPAGGPPPPHKSVQRRVDRLGHDELDGWTVVQ